MTSASTVTEGQASAMIPTATARMPRAIRDVLSDLTRTAFLSLASLPGAGGASPRAAANPLSQAWKEAGPDGPDLVTGREDRVAVHRAMMGAQEDRARAGDHLDLCQGHMTPVAQHRLHYVRGGPRSFHHRDAPAGLLAAASAEDSHWSVLSLCLDLPAHRRSCFLFRGDVSRSGRLGHSGLPEPWARGSLHPRGPRIAASTRQPQMLALLLAYRLAGRGVGCLPGRRRKLQAKSWRVSTPSRWPSAERSHRCSPSLASRQASPVKGVPRVSHQRE